MGSALQVRLDTAPTPERAARVLAVDDAPMNLELMAAMLEAVGYELEFAANGAEAVEMAQARDYDLILMDLQMPVMDGATATRQIRASGGPNVATPILAVTGSTQPLQVDACREAGMDDHIAKPVGVQDLIVKAARWTGRRRAA